MYSKCIFVNNEKTYIEVCCARLVTEPFIDKNERGWNVGEAVPILHITYCPFCGEKLP